MPIASQIAKLIWKSDSAAYEAGLKRIKARTESIKKTTTEFAKGAGILMAAAAAAAVGLVAAYRKQEVAENKLLNAIKSKQAATGHTLAQLKTMASRIQSTTTVGDEMALSIAEIGVRAGISAGNIKGFTESAINFASYSGRSALEVSRQMRQIFTNIHSAQSGLQALGISLTENEKERLKLMGETNDQMGIQAFVLGKLEGAYGGTAAAAAEGTGRFIQLGNTVGDLGELVGKSITEVFAPMAVQMKNWAESIIENWDAMGQYIESQINGLITTFYELKLGWLEFQEVFGADNSLEIQRTEAMIQSLTLNAAAGWDRVAEAKRAAMADPTSTAVGGGGKLQMPTTATGGTKGKTPDDPAIQAGQTDDPEALKYAQAAENLRKKEEMERAARAADLEEERRYLEQKLALQRAHNEGVSAEEIAFREREQELENERLALKDEKDVENFELKRELLRERLQALADDRIEFANKEMEAEDEKQKSTLTGNLKMLGGLFGQNKKFSAVMLALSKVTKIKELAMDLATEPGKGFGRTAAQYPGPVGLALGAAQAAGIVAQVAGALSGLRGAAKGGIVGGVPTPGRDSQLIAAMPGEPIIPLGKSWESVQGDIKRRGVEEFIAEGGDVDGGGNSQVVKIEFDRRGIGEFMRAEVARANTINGGGASRL